jgi:RNA-directed DNA polymerase
MESEALRKCIRHAGAVRQRASAGTPHRGVISPVLANIALDGLEAALQAVGKYYVVRYADDFIVTGYSKEELKVVKPVIG